MPGFLARVVENLVAGRRFRVPVMLWERMTETLFVSKTFWSEVLLIKIARVMSSASCESCLRTFLGCMSMFVEDGCVRVACILTNAAMQPFPGSGQEREKTAAATSDPRVQSGCWHLPRR